MKTLKILVKLILNCPRAHEITYTKCQICIHNKISLLLVDLYLLQGLARQLATFRSSEMDWDKLASEANEGESFQMH